MHLLGKTSELLKFPELPETKNTTLLCGCGNIPFNFYVVVHGRGLIIHELNCFQDRINDLVQVSN